MPLIVHAEETCEKPCPFHEPSDHLMRDWPKLLRSSGLVERLCTHVVGHPDPDSLAFLRRHDPEGSAGLGIHGCDGCCSGSYPLVSLDPLDDDGLPDENAPGCLTALIRLLTFRSPYSP